MIKCCFMFHVIIFINLLLMSNISSRVIIDSYSISSDSFIKEINKIQDKWKAGKNFHQKSELKNLISVSFKRSFKIEHKSDLKHFNFKLLNSTTEREFDSRLKWNRCETIGSVKAQGNCASSYAIVSAAVFSDRLCVQKNIVSKRSSEQILSCCHRCGGGCFGGHIEKSFMYMNTVGLITGGDYKSKKGCRPYSIKNCVTRNDLIFCNRLRNVTPFCYSLKCTNNKYKKHTYDNDKIKMSQIYSLPSNISIIKAEIIKNGPVGATITIYEDLFNYKSGVYYHTVGAKIGIHDVKIIGWGVTEHSNIPYWLIINSWSHRWGDNGTFKIKMGVNECDIEKHILTGSFKK